MLVLLPSFAWGSLDGKYSNFMASDVGVYKYVYMCTYAHICMYTPTHRSLSINHSIYLCFNLCLGLEWPSANARWFFSDSPCAHSRLVGVFGEYVGLG